MKRNKRTKKAYWGLVPKYFILILFLMVTLFPIFWMVTQSLKTISDATAIPPKLIFYPTLSNYKEVLVSPGFLSSFKDSLLVGFGGVAVALLIGAPFGYCLARFKYPGKEDVAFFVLSTRMMPPIVVIIPLLRVFSRLTIIDTHIGLIIANIMVNLALVVWLTRVFFASVPRELEEAATLDGCSHLGSFMRITLPLSAPGLVVTAILSFLFCWNEFFFALTLTSFNVRTMPVYLATTFVGYYAVDWSLLSAAGILSILPTIVLLLIIQKHLVKGLTFGALR